MKYTKFIHIVWFKSNIERIWFKEQYIKRYSGYRRSLVLYALRRLSLIFGIPMIKLEGDTELINLKPTLVRHGWRKMLSPSYIYPFNPLQVILDDYTCAEETLITKEANIQPFREHSVVADYVRFVVDFDCESMQTDYLHVTAYLGVNPP